MNIHECSVVTGSMFLTLKKELYSSEFVLECSNANVYVLVIATKVQGLNMCIVTSHYQPRPFSKNITSL